MELKLIDYETAKLAKEVGCGVLYKITNTINNKVYIGKTVNWKERFSSHTWALKNNVHPNKHLQNSFNRYGEKSFTVEILGHYRTGNLEAEERRLIEKHKSYDREIGYNKTTGGEENSFLKT